MKKKNKKVPRKDMELKELLSLKDDEYTAEPNAMIVYLNDEELKELMKEGNEISLEEIEEMQELLRLHQLLDDNNNQDNIKH